MIRMPATKVTGDDLDQFLLDTYTDSGSSPSPGPTTLAPVDEALLSPGAPDAPTAEPVSDDPELDAMIASETEALDAETEVADKIKRNREVLRARYAERAKAPASTEPGKYEQIFRKTHQRPKNIERFMGALGGALAGRGDGGHGAAAGQSSYDEGLAAAMARDADEAKARDYIDQGTAELLIKYYGMDPEDAANVRRDSQALALMNNLGSLDMRDREFQERNKDRDLQREMMNRKYDDDRELRLLLANQTDATRRYGIDARRKSGKGSGAASFGGASTKQLLEEAIDSNVSAKTSAFGGPQFTLDQAKQLREGTLDESTVDPRVLDSAKSALKGARYAARIDPKKFAGDVLGTARAEAGNVDAPGKSAATEAAKPEKKAAARRWINQNGRALELAISAFNKMSGPGRDAMVKLPNSPDGLNWEGFVRDVVTTDDDKNAARAIAALQNVITKERSGASVSTNEMQRLWEEFGQGKMKSPKQMAAWLRSLKVAFDDEQKNLEKEHPDLWD